MRIKTKKLIGFISLIGMLAMFILTITLRKYSRKGMDWSICNHLMMERRDYSKEYISYNDCWTGLGDNLMMILGYQLMHLNRVICLNKTKLNSLLVDFPRCVGNESTTNDCDFQSNNYISVYRHQNQLWMADLLDSDLSQLFSCYYKNKILQDDHTHKGQQCIHVRFGDWRLDPRITWDRKRSINFDDLKHLYYQGGVTVVFTDDPKYLLNLTGIKSVSKEPTNIMFDDGSSTIIEWKKLISCQFIHSFGQSKFSQTAMSLIMAGQEH